MPEQGQDWTVMSVTMETVDIRTLSQGQDCDVCHHGNGG